jgi:hypothetical protein
MNYRKLDGALAAALHESQSEADVRFPVFLRLAEAPPMEASEILRIPVDAAMASRILPMDLTAAEVAEFSDQPWVGSIRLAKSSRPLGVDDR